MVSNLDEQEMVFSIIVDLQNHQATSICILSNRCTLGLSFLSYPVECCKSDRRLS